MSEPIKTGDLVVVVRWPCCGKALGAIGTVIKFQTILISRCRHCGIESGLEGELGVKRDRLSLWPLQWVKRIPPLEELQRQHIEETEKA